LLFAHAENLQVINDLLVPRSSSLDLREDPSGGIKVAGLRSFKMTNSKDMMRLLEEGNKRRKTEPTKANAASSRSHAVLEINVTQIARNQVSMRTSEKVPIRKCNPHNFHQPKQCCEENIRNRNVTT
jgi:hypothetical protein